MLSGYGTGHQYVKEEADAPFRASINLITCCSVFSADFPYFVKARMRPAGGKWSEQRGLPVAVLL
uniref:Uncharacterized protein n=1 Tax=Romanomermis culicivorax TaxID=13658 RepID=A0A915KG23_ROMCU